MADFVAILSKTIDGLGERNTADMRQRVYERARKAIADKLAAIDPPPSKAQADRQYQLLDQAAAELELRYAPPAPKPALPADPLADFLASADDDLAAPAPAPVPQPKAADAFKQGNLPPFPGAAAPANAAVVPAAKPEQKFRPDPVLGLDESGALDAPKAAAKPAPTTGQGGSGAKGAILAVLGLLLIGGAGYAGYAYKDQILGSGQGTVTQVPTPAAKTEPAQSAETGKPADAGTDGQTAEKQAGGQQVAAADSTPPKMTQRLTEDGKEVEAGPGSVPQDIGEGSSVASATTPSTPPAADPNEQAQPQTIAVGQKAIFYEEKTGTEQGTADQGSIVWSVVQDSPGLDQPEEPAIRGDLTIPDKGLSVRMTIKRNVDKSLPASHIIEMLFKTPADFAGGAIESVSRFSMKDTEQAPGNPLVGVPAAFGDGFFLIALTDEKTAIDTNLQLFDRQEWIDIPVAYRTGRRALLSFEKGLSGEKVFKDVMKAWADKGSTTAPAADTGGNG